MSRGGSLQKAHFVKSATVRVSERQGDRAMASRSAGQRNVKSWSAGGHVEAADLHERHKDFLTVGELGRLLDAPRLGGTAFAIAC